MIEISNLNDLDSITKEVDMNKSMLITAPADSFKYHGKIMHYETERAVESAYGHSILTDSFALAKSLGVEDVFLCNIQNFQEYIGLADKLKHYDFAYVVPVGIPLGEVFYDAAQGRKKTFYSSYMVEEVSPYNHTYFVFSEKPAKLYENIDRYLEEMVAIAEEVKQSIRDTEALSSLLFCLNNLEDHQMANIVVASALCTSSIEEHAETKEYSRSVFDLDWSDVTSTELAVLRKDQIGKQRIENLVNFLPVGNPRKPLGPDRIVKYIKRNIDLSRFRGKPVSAYIMLRVKEEIMNQLDPLIGGALRFYEVESARFEKEASGVGSIYVDVGIWTSKSIERINVAVGGDGE